MNNMIMATVGAILLVASIGNADSARLSQMRYVCQVIFKLNPEGSVMSPQVMRDSESQEHIFLAAKATDAVIQARADLQFSASVAKSNSKSVGKYMIHNADSDVKEEPKELPWAKYPGTDSLQLSDIICKNINDK